MLAQIGQHQATDKFQKFDYGSAEQNEAAYGQAEPPQYDLGAITLKKIILVRSEGNDWLAPYEGQQKFIAALTGEFSIT